jgi:hypothetical protein
VTGPGKRQLVATLLALAVSLGADEVPDGWLKAGHHPEDYEVGLDRATRHVGEASAFIKSNGRGAEGFATLMQTVDATVYRHKRVRFSAFVKSEEVAKWAGLWVRVDGQPQGSRYPKALAFDNMHDRPIRGTTDWARYEIVVDVRKDAHTLSYAVQLSGPGRVWIDDVKVEVLPASSGSPHGW